MVHSQRVQRPVLIRLARYGVGLGLAAILVGVGALNWLPLSSVVLAGLLVLYVATRVDFSNLRWWLRRLRRRVRRIVRELRRHDQLAASLDGTR
jgi:hypothetical protein